MKSGATGGGLLTGCKMMLIQMPVFLWMFYVIRAFSMNKIDKADIYSFLYPYIHTGVDHIQSVFLWMDLLKPAYSLWISWIILTLLAWVLMYLQIKITTLNKPKTPSMPTQAMPGMPKMPDMSKMMWFMNIFMIVMMMWFVYTMPAGIGLYIITTTLFTVVQYAIQYKELLKVELMILTSKKSKDLATK